MAKKHSGQKSKGLIVSICKVDTPDARRRLCRVVDILLKSGVRGTIASEEDAVAEKEKPPRQIPHEEEPAVGDKR